MSQTPHSQAPILNPQGAGDDVFTDTGPRQAAVPPTGTPFGDFTELSSEKGIQTVEASTMVRSSRNSRAAGRESSQTLQAASSSSTLESPQSADVAQSTVPANETPVDVTTLTEEELDQRIARNRAEHRLQRKRDYVEALKRGEQPEENREPLQRSSSHEEESASSRPRCANAAKV
jgi:hypothetical protein